jgi:hypothetical protein
MGESFSDDDLRDLRRLLQQVALAAYPNPKREGCPGSAVLDEMASAPLPFEHPAYEHVKQCSPCLKEMLDLRSAKLRARRAASARRRKMWGVTGILAACLFTALLFIGPVLSRKHGLLPSSPAGAMAVWNMQSTTRGDSEASPQVRLEAPAQKGTITVYLPLGSDDGQYELQIRRTKETSALQDFVGMAHLTNGTTKLEIQADLSTLSPGSYWVAFRHADASWRFAALVVH